MTVRGAVWVVWAAALWTLLSSPPSVFAFAENTLLRACLVGIPVALWSGRATIRSLFVSSRFELAVLAGIVVLAAVLRFTTEALPWHAFDWLEILSERVVREPEPGWYANGFGVFMRISYALTHDFEWAIFNGNRVAGVLEIVAVWALARVVLEDGRAALVAAAVLAVVPLHVRMSASDSMQMVASLFSTIALAAFIAHAKSGDRALLAAGAMALAYAGLTRPDAFVLAAAVPFAYLAYRTHVRVALVAWAVAVAVSLPLALLGARSMASKLGGTSVLVNPVTAFSNWVTTIASLHDLHFMPAVAGTLGLLALVLKRRWIAVPLVVLLLARIEVAGFESNFANRWQLVVPELALLAVGVAVIVALLGGRVGIAVGAVMVLSSFITRAYPSAASFDQHQEYRFLRDSKAFAQIEGLGVARAVREAGEGEGAHFPTYRLPRETPRWSLHDLAANAMSLPVAYYRGLWCWTPEGLAPACRAVEDAFVLEELDSAPLDAPTFVGPGHPENARIGLYRVVRRR